MRRKILIVFYIISFLVFPIVDAKAQDLRTPLQEYNKIKEKIASANTADEPTNLKLRQDQINKSISIMVISINNQKDVVFSLESLQSDEKNQLVSLLQSATDSLMTKNTELTNTKNISELKSISQAIVKIWLTAQSDYYSKLAGYLNLQIDILLSQYQSRINSLTDRKEQLKTKNKDTTLLEGKISNSTSLYNEINAKNILAKQKSASINKESQASSIFNEVNNIYLQLIQSIGQLRQSLDDSQSELERLSQKLNNN